MDKEEVSKFFDNLKESVLAALARRDMVTINSENLWSDIDTVLFNDPQYRGTCFTITVMDSRSAGS